MQSAAVLASGALLALTVALTASGEIPAWSLHGSRFAALAPLAPAGSFPIRIDSSSTVVVRGDSNATDVRIGGAPAWPWWFARKLRSHVKIVVQAHGGDTAGQASQRHGDFARYTDLCILALGTNDAAPRGWLSDKRATPVAAYSMQMQAMIADCQAKGAIVVVLAPLPAGSRAMNRRLAPYRLVARDVAVAQGAQFLDPPFAQATFAGNSPRLLNYDALHLNAEAHQELGEWLAGKVTIAPGDPSK